MSIPYYDKQKTHNFSRRRHWTIYEKQPDGSSGNLPDKGDYHIYYIDSEWGTAGAGDPDVPEHELFTKLRDAFNDGSNWRIAAEDANSTGTYTLIIVRLKDRVVKKCVGVASNEKLANEALWTVTDVTGEVWYEELRRLRLLGNI